MGSLTNPQSQKITKTHPQYMLTMNIERKSSDRMNKIYDKADKTLAYKELLDFLRGNYTYG